jgi:hypothetical protein
VIEWLPTARAVVVRVAVAERSRATVPSVVDPSWKVTVPVGAISLGETARTTAVKVTGEPTIDGLAEEMIVALAAAGTGGAPGSTIWVKTADVPAIKFTSPLYTAEIACDPAVRPETLSVACPLESRTLLPRLVEPSRNVTLPLGVPLAGAGTVTVAVRTTGWPNIEGLGEMVSAAAVGT